MSLLSLIQAMFSEINFKHAEKAMAYPSLAFKASIPLVMNGENFTAGYAPVVALPIVCMLAALAVQHRWTLKQGDCKNAFIQSCLPEEEVTIVCPPSDCPISAHLASA